MSRAIVVNGRLEPIDIPWEGSTIRCVCVQQLVGLVLTILARPLTHLPRPVYGYVPQGTQAQPPAAKRHDFYVPLVVFYSRAIFLLNDRFDWTPYMACALFRHTVTTDAPLLLLGTTLPGGSPVNSRTQAFRRDMENAMVEYLESHLQLPKLTPAQLRLYKWNNFGRCCETCGHVLSTRYPRQS